MDSNILKIYCGVKYLDKDDAKLCGAKWNNDEKKWYFSYDLQEFINDESLHTYNYKPFRIDYIKCEFSKITDEPAYRFKDKIFNMIMDRYNDYCKSIEIN